MNLTLFFISFADLFVKVNAKILKGLTPDFIKYANLFVNTFVLPDPGPAIIIDGPELYSTAFL